MFVCEVCGERSEHAKFCTRDGSALVGTDDPFLGAEVGRYRLTRLLGRGGMGRVYAGVQPELGSRVAIKVLSDEASERPELVERFFNEARAVNMIHHEGIVNVIDLMRLPSGRPVIVMELVDGRTLREIVRAGPVPLGGIVQVMIEVLQALAAAHAIGIIHRDLKPDNILVTNAGRAKVLDFGVAKLSTNLQGDAHPTKTGAILGTPHYMSPEQIGGGTVDARADIYAAGIVLYEAVTGHLPFEGLGAFDLMRAHLEQLPPSPRELRPDLPRGIEQVILCALAKQRGERFTTANAMANALHEAASQLSADQWRALTTDARMFPRSFTPPAPIERQMTAPTGPMPGPQPGPQPTPLTRRDRPIAQASNHELAPVLEPTPMPPPRRSRVGIFAAIAAAILGAGIAAIVMSVRSPAASTTSPPPTGTIDDASRSPVVVASVDGDAGTVVTITLGDGGTTQLRSLPPLPVAMSNMDVILMSMPPDLRYFDPTAFITTAQQLAAKLIPDPQLVLMHFGPLFHDGHVDLTVDIDNKTRMWVFQTRTPEATKRADGKMLCTVGVSFPQVDIAPQVITVSGLREISCTRKMPLVARRCSPVQAWDRLVGSTKWTTHGTVVTWTTGSMARGVGGWQFDGEKTGETGKMVSGPDDCGVATHPPPAGATPSGSHPMPKGDGFYLDFPIDDHFDGVAYAPTALELARKIRPDAHLIEMRLAPIDSTGFARFAGFPGINPDFTYIFYSPAAAKEPTHDERRDDGLLLHLRGCEVFVQIEPRQKIITVKTTDTTTCKDNPEHMPRCTLQQLWAKGLAKGLKADVPAWTHYEYNRWEFSGEKGDDHTHFEFPDDCSTAGGAPAKGSDPFSN